MHLSNLLRDFLLSLIAGLAANYLFTVLAPVNTSGKDQPLREKAAYDQWAAFRMPVLTVFLPKRPARPEKGNGKRNA